MANKGGTILSGASGEISLRHRRTRALLLSTALVPALAVGALMVPTAAEASCTINSSQTTVSGNRNALFGPALGRDCNNSATVNSGVIVTGYGVGAVGTVLNFDANVTNNGSVSSTDPSGRNGVDVTSFGVSIGSLNVNLGDATYSGGINSSVDGAKSGIVVTGGDASATVTGGTVRGRDGDGINVQALGLAATIDLPNPLPDLNYAGGGKAEVTTSGLTYVEGSNNGIVSQALGVSYGTPRDVSSTVTVNGSGGVVGKNGDGIRAIALTGGIGGTPAKATTTVQGSSNVAGGQNGVTAISGSVNGDATTKVDLGSANGVGGNGNVTGGTNGIVAIAGSAGTDFSGIVIDDPSTWPVGAGKATVDVTTTGNVTAKNGTAITAIGVGNGGNKVTVDAEGPVKATGGFGVLAGSIGTGGTVDVKTTNTVSGTAGGVLGFNTDGNTNVNVTGNVVVAQGGLIGVGAISNNGNATVNFNGNIDPPLIGAGTLVIGNGTATTNTAGTIDADLIGTIAVNVGNGRAVTKNTADVSSSNGTGILGVGAVKFGNANGTNNPDVSVKNYGTVTDYDIGVLGYAQGTGNHVVVDNQGSVDVGLLGVGGFGNGAGSTVDVSTTTAGSVKSAGAGVVGGAFGGNGTVNVETYGSVQGTYLGVGGVIEGDNSKLTLITRSDVVSSQGFGVAGLGSGNGNTINITTNDRVEGALLGVGGLNFGDNSKVTVLTKDEVASSDGFGVFGGAIGQNGGNSVAVTTENDVSGRLLGVGGVIGGNGSDLTIKTEARVTSSDGFGVAGLSFGDGNTVKVTTEKAVSGDLLGVGALGFGTTDVTVLTKDTVTSDSGFGVFGGALGSGASTVKVTTEKEVAGDLLGVGGLLGGTGGSLTVETKDKVTSDNGFGVAALAFGNGNTVNVTTDKTVDGRYLGVGALAFGTNDVTVLTKDVVTSSDGFGVFGGSIGSGASNVKVTTEKAVSGDLLGVGGVLGGTGGTLAIETKDTVTSASGFGVAGLAFGDQNTVTVKTDAAVSGDLLGVGALSVGDGGTVDVHTYAAVTSDNGIGVLGANIGAADKVTVTTDGTVNAGFAGVVGVNTGGAVEVNVNQKVTIANGGVLGAAAIGGGSGSAVLNVNGAIDPAAIGAAAATFGSGTAQANIYANVQATTIGVVGLNVGTGDIDVNIFAGAPIQSDGIGISTFKVGDSGATTIDVDSAIGGLSQAATGGDGITAVAISLSPTANTPITINTTANGTINAGDDGISVNLLGGGDVNVTTNALVTAGDDGIQVRSIALSTGNVTVTNEAAVNAGDNGIFILKGGDGDVLVNANANISAATGNGIEANALVGTGNVTVALKDATTITADDIGIIASKSFGTGDVKVTIGEGSTIDANLGGIVALKAFGDSASGTAVLVETGKNSSITATNGIGITAGQGFGDGNLVVSTGEGSTINAGLGGIVALKLFGDSATVGGDAVTVTTGKNSAINTAGVGITAGQSFGDGNVVVTTGEGSTIGSLATPTFAGIVAGKAFGDGNLTTTTGLNSIIFAGTNGITSAHLFGTGDNTVTTGENSAILAGNDGIYATSLFTTGATNVTTGTNSLVSALDDGIVANKFGGSGDVSVTVGSTASVAAGDDGIRVSNRSFGAGDINVNVLGGTSVKATQVVAGDDAIHAHGWDNVNVTTGSYALIIGDADENGVGNAIRISDADIATVSIGANNVVSGSGQTWSNAVISVRSDDATNITVGADSLVSSWAYAFHGDVVTAASQIVIDTDGGATTIDNFGTIVGRVGLTGNDDVFNNYSSNTWVTVGNNYFGGGTDAINNPGRIVTALQGAVAETTSFYSLETFNNGDAAYVGAGLLDLRDEAPGQIAWNGARDVTYVSGVFHGVGNSTVGLDSFLGAAGSTSDILQVGGRDVNGDAIAGLVTPGQTALLIHDVNTGAGAWNLAGIKVVDVVDPAGVTYGKNTFGETPSFVISSASANYSAKFGGVIDKGLFFYDLVAIGNDQYLIGLPDQEVFELPKLVTGAQSVWHETTGVWLDRQADLRTYLQGTTTTLVTKEGVKTVNGAPASVTPGVWGKVVGSWGSRDASDSYSAYGRNYGFDTGYDQNTYGFMAGADFGKEGVFGPNDAVVFGVLGGYLTSDLSFSGSPSTADYSGGTVGVYATYINNNWYLDALFKADFLSMDYQAPTLVGAGYFGQSPDAKNYGFVIDTGYRFYKWGASGFVDGLATLSYVNTNISDLTIAPGTLVDFGNNDSLRGSVGLRVGANAYDAATYRVEASLTGRLWYEFLGDNAVTIYNPGLPFTTVDTFDGLFGEVGVGLNFFAKDSGWNGFTNADIKFGDSYVAGSAKGGVRYQW
ncbi:hypothetical protein [Xanthobacter autotrophicus]|uniref:hypothetical protein n=1 Tax=Xanthobacter autotrophicus TaxID=280 RepID=UPI0037263041